MRGCLAGAEALPVDGPSWQVMRLNRNRNWGHLALVDYLEKLARDVPRITGWAGLLVGDTSQPRGGPMLTGHASHQIGLDADVWLMPMPRGRLDREQRENMSAVNMASLRLARRRPPQLDPGPYKADPHRRGRARVERIFVNPALKVALCREAGADKGWLEKVRPIWGHNYHFHIRLACPAGMASCQGRSPRISAMVAGGTQRLDRAPAQRDLQSAEAQARSETQAEAADVARRPAAGMPAGAGLALRAKPLAARERRTLFSAAADSSGAVGEGVALRRSSAC
jgi:murein endopeptidase